IMIEQHEHARLSAWLALLWGNQQVPAVPAPREALHLAVALHDAGWLELDRRPSWNAAESRPYSFVDLPIAQKLPHYRRGIDLVAEQDAYAAYLCSRHYTSFF